MAWVRNYQLKKMLHEEKGRRAGMDTILEVLREEISTDGPLRFIKVKSWEKFAESLKVKATKRFLKRSTQ